MPAFLELRDKWKEEMVEILGGAGGSKNAKRRKLEEWSVKISRPKNIWEGSKGS